LETGGRSSPALGDIRSELRKALKESIIDRIAKKEKTVQDLENENILRLYRKQNALLKDFGW
jgi:hypothetical protein